MASGTAMVQLFTRPLTTGDAAGLLDDIEPSAHIQPSMIAETEFSNPYLLSSSGLTTAGDILRFLFTPDDSNDNVVWQCVAMRAVFVCAGGAGFAAFIEDEACYTINKPGADRYPWNACTVDTLRTQYDGTTLEQQRTINPDFHAYPPVFAVADGATQTLRALGGLSFAVATYDATAKANTSVYFDARWLGFPRVSARNAALYVPRLGYKGQ